MFKELRAWISNRRQARRTIKKLRRILRDAGTDRLSFAEYGAKKQLHRIQLEEVSLDDFKREISLLEKDQKAQSNLHRAELVLLGGIALYLFGVGSDILLGTFSLQISAQTAAATLFIFSMLNIISYATSERISIRRCFILLMIEARPDLDPSGLRRLNTKLRINILREFGLDFKEGRVDINAVGTAITILQTISALVLFGGFFVVLYIPMAAAWQTGEGAGWDTLHIVLFVFVVLGLLAKFGLSAAFEYLKIRFVDPRVSQTFWRNYGNHGWDVAVSALYDQLERK